MGIETVKITRLIVLTETQPFFLNTSDCWQLLVNFQWSKKVDFDNFIQCFFSFHGGIYFQRSAFHHSGGASHLNVFVLIMI